MKQSAKNMAFTIPTAVAMAFAIMIGTHVRTNMGNEISLSPISGAQAASGQQKKTPKEPADKDKLIIQIP